MRIESATSELASHHHHLQFVVDPPSCDLCGARLAFVHEGDGAAISKIYRCDRHGRVRILGNGTRVLER